jgi:hypothetical protein
VWKKAEDPQINQPPEVTKKLVCSCVVTIKEQFRSSTGCRGSRFSSGHRAPALGLAAAQGSLEAQRNSFIKGGLLRIAAKTGENTTIEKQKQTDRR